ncbi:MAG: UDP-N-acetylmuramate--L-alanine ligase [Candidatus Xiphinematobacter sp.]|nr:MAG: UDP-N-acetylmuramate--L-alanine ligase [Candidatus Xiphinematobacter sp.]
MITASHLASILLVDTPLRIHLIGVAGSGMSALAVLLLALGHRVSGSDKVDTLEVQQLSQSGLVFETPHRAEHVWGVDLVAQSSAIKPGNVALDEAVRLGIPIARRADVLAAIMMHKRSILVCGMHGKTTTAAMATHVLRLGGLKPCHYVGANIPILGANARWESRGEYFVAEGDESDGSLSTYFPEHALVLNVEPEHLDFYQNQDAIDDVFFRLISQTSGWTFYCADDTGAKRICTSHPRTICYGTGASCDYRMELFSGSSNGKVHTRFGVRYRKSFLGNVQLNVPGKHNALNALAVTALALELGVPFELIKMALQSFRGAERRFEIKFRDNLQAVVDDYGHHPTEIQATLSTAQSLGFQRIIALFQPHRYSRTQALRKQFGTAFYGADHVLVTDVYPAGEEPIPGVSGQTIVEALREAGHPHVQSHTPVATIHQQVGGDLLPGDLVISLGAGNIGEASDRLARDLTMRKRLLAAMGSGSIRLYEPMSKHTTLRVGGPAQFWAEPQTEEGFIALVQFCFSENIPIMVIGRGSNLLVKDGGVPGVVVHLGHGQFLQSQLHGHNIVAGAGVRLKQISCMAHRFGIGGFEWMEGIPGSLGGGLRMNAGAMEVQLFDQVVCVRCCDREGNILLKTPPELNVRYRNTSDFAHHYVLSATLQGYASSPEEINRRLRESKRKRSQSQPIAASAGCIFKNPREVPAGKLIEELGLKNFFIGGARISEIHGNFIVNDGSASAEAILTLIKKICAVAKQKRGIELNTEVQIVGENL